MNRADLLLGAFPRLEEAGFDVTSPATPEYNCIAFAADDQSRWWWPTPFGAAQLGGYYWPAGVPVAETLESFVQAYATLGYAECGNGDLEPGFEKIAIYSLAGSPTHAARQLESGVWVSKLGGAEDIEHAAATGVCGAAYGEVALYMRRPRG